MYATVGVCRLCPRHTRTIHQLSSSPKYPEILDLSKKAVAQREKLAKHKRIEALETVEEKLFALNLDKYYGWNSYILKEGEKRVQFLPFVEHITRTQLVEVEARRFQSAQGIALEEAKEWLERIRPHLQEAILFQLRGVKDETAEKLDASMRRRSKTDSMVLSLNSVLHTYFSSHSPHLLESMVDYRPRVEGFWCVGGFHPSPQLYQERSDNKALTKDEVEERVEHWFQYLGSPICQLRSGAPLPPLQLEEALTVEPAAQLPTGCHQLSPPPPFPSDPSLVYDLPLQRRHGTNIPGFWPGDKLEFPLLSYLQSTGLESDSRGHHSQGILAGFASLLATASYQGFSTFSELTYPLTSQLIVTDGQFFSFYLYQLNTTLLHSEYTTTNPRVNLCLVSGPSSRQPLYRDISGSQFIGWNDEVLKSLISCYLMRPDTGRSSADLKPYLSQERPYVKDLEDPERRTWLHNQFRHMYSNRPRHKLPYEIYDWERIYKIKFPTRPMEPRRRPFELDSNPLEDRKYWEHAHPYIRRADRTRRKHWTNWRAKMAKTYYPEV